MKVNFPVSESYICLNNTFIKVLYFYEVKGIFLDIIEAFLHVNEVKWILLMYSACALDVIATMLVSQQKKFMIIIFC